MYKNEIDISFIIPMYNSVDTIEKTIESIINQQNCGINYEIICVDDGSTDDTSDLIYKKYPQIKLIKKINGGTASARNAALEIINGKYVMFVDADDSISYNYFEALSPQICDDYDIILFGYSIEYLDRREVVSFSAESPCEAILLGGTVWNKLFRSKIIKTKFNENNYFEDVEFLFQLLYDNMDLDLKVINDPIYSLNRTLFNNKISTFKESDYILCIHILSDLVQRSKCKVKYAFCEILLGVFLSKSTSNKIRYNILKIIFCRNFFFVILTPFNRIGKFRARQVITGV